MYKKETPKSSIQPETSCWNWNNDMCGVQAVLYWSRFACDWTARHGRLANYAHAAAAVTREECRQETWNQKHSSLTQEVARTDKTQTHSKYLSCGSQRTFGC